jgi:hypothetical protein
MTLAHRVWNTPRMRWFVTSVALFDSVYDESVVDNVALLLEPAGVLFGGDDSVQGDPGPAIAIQMVLESDTLEDARDKASGLVLDALGKAGARPGSYRLERPRVVPMAGCREALCRARTAGSVPGRA